ncbi:unnamed protein product, partial [Adineta steineri]
GNSIVTANPTNPTAGPTTTVPTGTAATTTAPTGTAATTTAPTGTAATTTAPTGTAAVTTKPTSQPLPNTILASSIRIEDVMHHLDDLQIIATNADGNRAIHTRGFNETLDYIYNVLKLNTNYNITQSFFPVRDSTLASNPVLLISINDAIQNYTYSTNLAIADFTVARFSTSLDLTDYVAITVIPNLGCDDTDWENNNMSVAGQVALVKRGNCTFVKKAQQASKYNVTALFIYNDGAPGNVRPMSISVGEANEIPVLSLSYTLGQELADAVQDPANNVTALININLLNDKPLPVGNICADTPSGDPAQTIVIGSHSDSVPAGPGINDNGSGSAANLGLAIALARLFQTPNYPEYKYRIRFCWWGAEEVGLLGSNFHVRQAKNATTVGERLQDYLINLNYDMLGSPNYIFGIYDGQTANNDTPSEARPGSDKITALFRDWFDTQKLPWNNTDFSGRSDYGPFLAEGIVAGGLFTGGDDVKDQQTRDYMDQMLGQGMGGIAGADYDPCYHKACDSIQNINEFAFEKMMQAAAYALESLARQDNLTQWLYPNGRSTRSNNESPQRKYDSINEYFGMPYL